MDSYLYSEMLLPLDQVALCHSENDFTFREIGPRVQYEVNISFARYFVVTQAISPKT